MLDGVLISAEVRNRLTQENEGEQPPVQFWIVGGVDVAERFSMEGIVVDTQIRAARYDVLSLNWLRGEDVYYAVWYTAPRNDWSDRSTWQTVTAERRTFGFTPDMDYEEKDAVVAAAFERYIVNYIDEYRRLISER